MGRALTLPADRMRRVLSARPSARSAPWRSCTHARPVPHPPRRRPQRPRALPDGLRTAGADRRRRARTGRCAEPVAERLGRRSGDGTHTLADADLGHPDDAVGSHAVLVGGCTLISCCDHVGAVGACVHAVPVAPGPACIHAQCVHAPAQHVGVHAPTLASIQRPRSHHVRIRVRAQAHRLRTLGPSGPPQPSAGPGTHHSSAAHRVRTGTHHSTGSHLRYSDPRPHPDHRRGGLHRRAVHRDDLRRRSRPLHRSPAGHPGR